MGVLTCNAALNFVSNLNKFGWIPLKISDVNFSEIKLFSYILPKHLHILGYQCMAGFGGGSDDGSADNSAGPTTCNLLIPSGNLVNALKHWQYKHKNSKLKEFLFMVTHSQKLITVSSFYVYLGSRMILCFPSKCSGRESGHWNI